MKTDRLSILLFSLFIVLFAGCGGNGSEASSAGAYAEGADEDVLEAARTAAREANPDGQEFILEDEGIFIMLPSDDWKESSREEGCIGFSSSAGLINVYYGEDDGSAYDAVPESEADARKILDNAQIPEQWAEFLDFDFHTEGEAKIYSYTIRFCVPDNEGAESVFYTVSESVCRKDKVYVVVGQIYDEEAVQSCKRAIDSFVVTE